MVHCWMAHKIEWLVIEWLAKLNGSLMNFYYYHGNNCSKNYGGYDKIMYWDDWHAVPMYMDSKRH